MPYPNRSGLWGLLLAGLLLQTMPADATPQTPAHYIVFEKNSGYLTPRYHAYVNLSGVLPQPSAAEIEAKRASLPRHIQAWSVTVENGHGEMIYRSLAQVPRWFRGEFHSTDNSAIEGHTFPAAGAAFVVRVPAGRAARLRLSNMDSGETQLFDLAALAHNLPRAATATSKVITLGQGQPDPGNRVDLLLIGEGYTADQTAQFQQDLERVVAGFFGITPYGEYRNFVSIKGLMVPSNQAGADHPPYDPNCPRHDLSCCADPAMQFDPDRGTLVDTAFDATYCTENIHRFLTLNDAAVLAAAAQVPDWDQVMVIVNDPVYGGSARPTPVLSTHPQAVEIAQHEYGHAFTGLADEYVEAASIGVIPDCSDLSGPPCEPNVTDQSTPGLIKWQPWIGAQTPIPTPEGNSDFQDSVGLFEGARYLESGMYRSGDICAMRVLGAPFCQVPSQAYVLRLYGGGWGVPAPGIDTIEPGSEQPTPGDVGITQGETIHFGVTLLQPQETPSLDVAWFIDDQRIDGETHPAFSFTPANTGLYTVRLEVNDNTPLVHPAMADGLLTRTRTWQINVEHRRCDLNNDGLFDAADVKTFSQACRRGDTAWPCDLNADGRWSARDSKQFWRECGQQGNFN